MSKTPLKNLATTAAEQAAYSILPPEQQQLVDPTNNISQITNPSIINPIVRSRQEGGNKLNTIGDQSINTIGDQSAFLNKSPLKGAYEDPKTSIPTDSSQITEAITNVAGQFAENIIKSDDNDEEDNNKKKKQKL